MNEFILLGFIAVIIYTCIASIIVLNKIMKKLDTIAHDLQQIKVSQRASQKRERKVAKELKRLDPVIWEK